MMSRNTFHRIYYLLIKETSYKFRSSQKPFQNLFEKNTLIVEG
jgi:hypothetical protein